MKFLVLLMAVAAVALAKPGYLAAGPIAPGLLAAPSALSYIGAAPYGYSAAPLAYSTAHLTYSAAPAVYNSAPAVYSAAPAVYSAAPAVYAAAAPAVVTKTVAAAPAIAYSAAPAVLAAPAAVKSQYHAQDELGNTAFGHSEPGQVHTSVQDAAGNRVGSFSYLNPTDGQVHRTDYVADAGGYRVAANDLPLAPAAGPVPVAETAEVVAARAAHLAAHSRARRSVLVQTPASTAPLAAPVAVAAPALVARTVAPVAYHAPAPLAYSAHLAYSAPLAYAAAPAPVAYSAVPAGIPATLTTIVNNPGHAVSYRID